MIKILQITDTHLDEKSTTHGHNVYEKLSLVLQQTIEKEEFDLIVFSGDISDKGSLKAYQWLAEKTKVIAEKIIWMPGNHDDFSNMKQALKLAYQVEIEDNKLNYQINLEGLNILCLDTREKYLSQTQINWLIQATNDNTIIFTHHPPLLCHSPFMDHNYCLENWEFVKEKLTALPHINFRFFCGHYHQDSYYFFKNIHIFLTPSTMFQIDRHQPHFQIHHHQSGYRIIELFEDKSLKTYCNYISLL